MDQRGVCRDVGSGVNQKPYTHGPYASKPYVAPEPPYHGSGSQKKIVMVPAYDDKESEATFTELIE
jgi:hypothetical protein